MRVVKLGGSLAYSDTLPHWLRLLKQDVTLCTLIVPGGGPFADQVRLAQSHWAFNDPIAHSMALLAMCQFGLMLKGICPEIELATSKQQLKNAIDRKKTAIWLPDTDWLNNEGIAASWAITSDSLSAWLAQHFTAEQLLLVKSVSFSRTQTTVKQIIRDETVDTAFAQFLSPSEFSIRLYNQHDWIKFEQSMIDQSDTGVIVSR